MASIVRSVRSTHEEWAAVEERAHIEGLPVNSWIRRALRDTVELERMIDRQADLEQAVQPAFTQRHERNR